MYYIVEHDVVECRTTTVWKDQYIVPALMGLFTNSAGPTALPESISALLCFKGYHRETWKQKLKIIKYVRHLPLSFIKLLRATMNKNSISNKYSTAIANIPVGKAEWHPAITVPVQMKGGYLSIVSFIVVEIIMVWQRLVVPSPSEIYAHITLIRITRV